MRYLFAILLLLGGTACDLDPFIVHVYPLSSLCATVINSDGMSYEGRARLVADLEDVVRDFKVQVKAEGEVKNGRICIDDYYEEFEEQPHSLDTFKIRDLRLSFLPSGETLMANAFHLEADRYDGYLQGSFHVRPLNAEIFFNGAYPVTDLSETEVVLDLYAEQN